MDRVSSVIVLLVACTHLVVSASAGPGIGIGAGTGRSLGTVPVPSAYPHHPVSRFLRIIQKQYKYEFMLP